MPASPFSLDTLRDIIAGQFPQLASSRFTLLAAGWDSVAVDVDDQLIFKFPRHQRGAEALRREAAILDLVARHVTMRVPALTLFETPTLFSRHGKIPGEHLLVVHYSVLDETARQALGEALGLFYAQLHTITPDQARAAGAEPADAFLPADEILRLIAPVLPESLRTFAQTTMAQWAALPPDPYGMIYGFFDGHGWNMAFDSHMQRLNGIYDFADSGIGPLHQEFIYSNLISTDLTARIISAYEHHTGRNIDRDRVDLLTATHRLWELAVEAHLPDNIDGLVATIAEWAYRT